MIKYHFNYAGGDLPPISRQHLYEIVVAGSGIYQRAARENLEVCIPHGGRRDFGRSIPGLADCQPYVTLPELVPWQILGQIWRISAMQSPNEVLFWLRYGAPETPTRFSWGGWSITSPNQVQSPGRVYPVDPYAPEYQSVLIEIHSHHEMSPFFSHTDNDDERAGFRIFGVIGSLTRKPAINLRVGVYGNFCSIPAAWVFDGLPDGLLDFNSDEYLNAEDMENEA